MGVEGRNASKKRPRQREGRPEPLTRETPSDHRKSPSMVLSLSPIHWYSRYRSGEEPQGRRRCAVSFAASRWRPFPVIGLSVGARGGEVLPATPNPRFPVSLSLQHLHKGGMEGRGVGGEGRRKISPGLEKGNSGKSKNSQQGQSRGE